MSRNIVVALILVVASACAWSWKPLAYQPKPIPEIDAREVAATLIKSNTRQGCVTETQFSDVLLNVQFVCNWGMGNSTVRFDQVDKIYLQTSHDWTMVRVEHKNGLGEFEWSSKVRGDMEKLADALHTLARLTPVPAADEERTL